MFQSSPAPEGGRYNTLLFVEVVFKDEVTVEDKAGKETPLQALDRLTPAQRIGVLGVNKHQVFKDGILTQGMIKAPWANLQKRIVYSNRGLSLKGCPFKDFRQLFSIC